MPTTSKQLRCYICNETKDATEFVSSTIDGPCFHRCISCDDVLDDEQEQQHVAGQVLSFLRDYVVFSTWHEAVATTLWVLHTYIMNKIETTPRLSVCAPEKQAGKTRLLECLEVLCRNTVLSYNTSSSALVRMVEMLQPTILLDEIDALFNKQGEHEDVRALINAGYRQGSSYVRCVSEGNKQIPTEFPAYCAVAMAGIGAPPETIYDRSIIVNLRRKTPDEPVKRFRRKLVADRAKDLEARIAEWAETVPEMTNDNSPKMPTGISDRQEDIWEPLIYIADMFGDTWADCARQACEQMTTLQKEDAAEDSRVLRLLGDIADIWDTQYPNDDFIATDDLLTDLYNLEGSEWGEQNDYGRQLFTQYTLSRLLKPYRIKPKQVRIGESRKRGYLYKDFTEVWKRYLVKTDDVTV